MKSLFVFLQCAALIFLCGCISPEEELPLVGKTYKVHDRNGHYATISFNKDNTVNGFSGVNRIFGNYRAVGDVILFSQLGSTKMAGHPEAMKFEDKFISVLARTGRFCEIGSSLTFFDGEMPLMTLKMIEKNEP